MAGAAPAPVLQLMIVLLLSSCQASLTWASQQLGEDPAVPVHAANTARKSLLDSAGRQEVAARQQESWTWHAAKLEVGGGRQASRPAPHYSIDSSPVAEARVLQVPAYEDDLTEWETVRTFSLAPRNSSTGELLRIGTVFSISSPLGQAYLAAYSFFFERVTRFPHKQQLMYGVELHIYDHLGDDYMEEVLQSMMDRGIELFLGPTTFDGTLHAARFVQESGNLIVGPAAPAFKEFEQNDRVFGTAAPPGDRLSSTIDLLASKGAQTVAVFSEDGQEVRRACDSVPEHAEKYGLRVVMVQGIDDFTEEAAVILPLQDNAPDVVILCSDVPSICNWFFKILHSNNVNPKALVVSGESWKEIPFLTTDSIPGIWLGHWALGIENRFKILPLSLDGEYISQEDFKWEVIHTMNYKESDSLRAGFLPAYMAISSIFLAAQQAESIAPDDIGAAIKNLANISYGSGMKTMDFDVLQKADDWPPYIVGPPERATYELFYPRPPYRDWICYEDPQHSGHDVHVGMRPVGAGTFELACQDCPDHMMSVFDADRGYSVCENCLAGRVMLEGGQCIACDPGRMHDQVAGKCMLCPEGRFQNLSEQTFCHACPAGSYQGRPGETLCSPCQAVEMDGVIFYNTKSGGSTCHACPAGALCEQDEAGLHSRITTQDMYYLLPSSTPGDEPTAFFCPHGKGKACGAYGRCLQDPVSGEEIMEGPFCGKCKKGFAKVDDHFSVCSRCKGLGNAIGVILFNIFVMSLLVSLVSLMIMTTDFSRPTQLHSVVVKQFFNYLHMARVVAERVKFSLYPSYDLTAHIDFLTSITGLQAFQTGFSTFSVSCFTAEALPTLQPFQTVQVLGLVWVPFSMLVMWAGFEICRAVALRWGVSPPGRERLTTLFTVYLFFMLSPVTEMNLTSWNCYHYDEPRSAHDPSLLCFSQEIQRWQIAGAIGTILFSLGIPLGLYLLLLYYERQGRLRDPEVLKMLGFLTSGFETDYWYFECIYMLRKVLFTLILQLPGLSASDARETRDIQNMILVFNCGVFLALQLYFQPYDNRGYFVLDKIETASLTAIMVTPTLGVWLSERNHAYLFESLWINQIQQIVCMTVISALHGRALAWVLWGTMRGPLTFHVHARRDTYWICRKLQTVLVPPGSAIVTPEGMKLKGVQGISWKLFSDMLTGLLLLQVQKTGHITYEGIAASFQRVMVETHFVRELEDFHHQNPLRFFFRRLKQRVERLPCGKALVVALIHRAEDVLRSKGFRVSERKPMRRTRSATLMGATRSSRSRHFTEENLTGTYGEEFSIEELHAAFILLRKDAYQAREFLPLQPISEVFTNKNSSMTTRTSTVYSDEPSRANSQNRLLTVEQVIDSALRAQKQEKFLEMSEIHAAKVANRKLEEELRKVQALLAETQAALSRTVACEAATPFPHPQDTGLADTAHEEEPSTFQEFVVAVEANSRLPAATVPPRASCARPSLSAASQDIQQESRPSGSAVLPCLASQPAEATLPHKGAGEEGGVSHRGQTTANSSPSVLENEVGPELQTPKARYEKMLSKPFGQQPRSSENDEVDLGSITFSLMHEELASLARQRDHAVLQAEKAELSLEQLKFQLRKAHSESMENAKKMGELEAKVEKLEAVNSSWKRWAQEVRGTGATVEEFSDGLLHTLRKTDRSSEHDPALAASSVGQPSNSAFLKSCARSPRTPKVEELN